MEIRIFDVEHGFCAYIVADNGNVMLIDCGHNEQTGFRPSNYLPENGCPGIERLIISNYDEDHLSDLPNLRGCLPISILRRNRSITPEQLKHLKRRGGPLQPGMQALLEMLETYTSDVTDPPEFPQTELETFHNRYPNFEDTNNLSLVTFLHYGNIHMVFPGDLEKAGWRALLANQSFCNQLSRVNIFVASHHGRENGYSEEVFEYCQPDVVIISDESIQYQTQEVDYSKHANGIRWGDGYRYVFTTRNDGMITIKQIPGQGPTIETVY